MKNNRYKRMIYGALASVIVIGSIGGVAANETRHPYKAPELLLTQGQTDYDLTEGIEYDSTKYLLSVEDTGNFDINIPGRYEVSYALTPYETQPEATVTPEATLVPETTVVPGAEATTVPGAEATQAPGAEVTTAPETEATTAPGAEATEVPGTEATQAPGAEATEAPGAEVTTAPETEPTQAPETTTPDPVGGELEEVQPGDIAAEEAGGQLSAVMNNVFGKVSAAEIEVPSAAAEVVSFETTLEEGAPAAAEGTETVGDPAATEAPDATEGTGTVTTDPAVTEAPGTAEGTETAGDPAATVTPDTAENPDASEAPAATQTPASDTVPGVIRFTRTVIVVGDQKIIFDAAPLYIGVEDIDYDLTTDVTAVDEYDNPVEEIYVVDDSNLQAAKEMVTDEETGEEKEQYITGSYLITLGAKHPVTEQEFLTEREVQVTNGLYLYAPPIEIEVGSTNYDILDGLQLRSIDETVEGDETTGSDEAIGSDETIGSDEAVEAVSTFAGDESEDRQLEFSIGELSKKMLETNSMNDEELFDYIEEMEERQIETDAAKEALLLTADEAKMSDSLPLKEGVYPVEVQAVDKTSGDTYTGTRMVIVRSVQNNDAMAYQVKAYADSVQDPYKDGDIYRLAEKTHLTYPEVYSGGTFDGVPVPAPSIDMYNYVGQYIGGSDWRYTYQYKFGKNDKNNSLAANAGLQGGYEIYTSNRGNNGNPVYYWGIFPREYMRNGTIYLGQQAYHQNVDAVKINPYSGYYFLSQEAGDLPPYVRNDAYIDSVATWNTFIGSERNLLTMKEGGAPDVLVTANKTLVPDNLNFERMTESFKDITPESSIQIDLQGQVLKGNNKEQAMPAMQVSIENAKLNTNSAANRMVYNVPANGYLRIKGFRTEDDLKDNTIETNLRNKQMYIKASGEATVEFHGSDDSNIPDEVYAFFENASGKRADVILRTDATGGDIKTPKYFNVTNGTMAYTVDVAKGTKIEAFNLNGGMNAPAASLMLGGGGMLCFNKDLNIIDNKSMYANAIANKVELTGDLSVLKSDKAPEGTADAVKLAAIEVRGALISNGHKIAAGVNKADNAAPAQNEVFATADCVLDPTDFTVNSDTTGNAWVNDGTWFMANATDNNKQIVFVQNEELLKYPIQVTHNGITVKKTTYKEALDYIENQADTAYTVTCLRPMDFTDEDLAALKSMKKTGRSIIFTGETTGAGAATYGKCYHVRFRQSVIEMPVGYDITWDQPVKYDKGDQEGIAENKEDHLEFIKNGKTLTFEVNYMTVAAIRENADTQGTYDTLDDRADVYGGAANGPLSTPSAINIKAGKFRSGYGGNKEGSHTGNAVITVDSTAVGEDQIAIGRLDGASVGESTKPDGRTATISTTGNVTIQNLYNYDVLTVRSGALTIPNGTAAKETNLNAQLAVGYIGKTILNDEATLQLLNANGIRKLGSLVRPAGADVTKTASVVLKRAVTEGTYGADSKLNPYLVELTAKDPLNMDSFTAGRLISVSYDDSTTEKSGDIIFNLTGVEDTTEAKNKYVTVRSLKNSFTNKMVSDQIEKTIKLAETSVLLLNDKEEIISTNLDIAGALVELAKKEETAAGGNYTIAIFKEGYKVSALDREAMDLVLGKKTGKLHYLEEDYTNLAEAAKAAKVTWSGAYDSTGVKKNNYKTVYPDGNLVLFGAENVITGMKLNYTGVTGDKNIYANGRPLTLESTVSIEGKEYPGLYGGAEDGTGTKKDLTVLANITLQDVKNFQSLTIGDGGTAQTTLTIAGTLDSDPANTDNTRTDTVYLKNAVLKFTGTEEGHIGNLEADGNSKNTINIFKDANGTKPLQLDGDLKIKDSKSPVQITLNGTAAARKDKVLHFYAKKADENKAKSIITNFITMTYKNNEYLILERSNVTWKFTTASGLAGTFNSMGATNGDSFAAEVKGESTSTTKADWNDVKGTSNNRGFVEIGADGHLTWLDEPEVKISPVAGSALRDYYWTFAHAVGDTNSIRNAFNNQTNKSSVELDFGNDGINQGTGGRIGYTNGYPDLNGMQISYRRANIGDYNQYDGYRAVSVKGIDLISNDQVLRLDEIYGNGYGWTYQSWDNKGAYGPNIIGVYAGYDNGGPELPGSIVQIRLSDTFSQNPAYQLGWKVGSIMIQSGKKVPDNEISVVNFLKTTQVDLKDGNTVKFAGIWGQDNKNTLIEFLGTGKVYMTNLYVPPVIGIYEANDLIRANTVALRDGNVSVAKGRSDLTSEIIYVKDDLITNGYKIRGLRLEGTQKNTAEKDLRENDVFARSPLTGKLDATDFVLEKPVEGTNGLYFSSKDNGMTIYVTKLATKPIKVNPAVGGETYFDSYQAALKAIKTNGTGAEYTITNLIERDFTAEDYAALQAITTDKTSGLIFESGTRRDTDGAAGTRYRVRMRVQTLELPKAVNVTFQNIVMKYDQGENSEIAGSQEMVFVGNGGVLKFGDGVVFLQHNDETMKPVVYGGSVNGTNDTLSTVIINSGNFKAVYGAGTVPQTKGSKVSISGGSVDKVFAGGTGNGTVTGDTSITVAGGNINCPIYGGGEGAKVTGNTKVEVTGGIFDKSPDKSVYGGGKGAEVEGKSDVNIIIDNSAGEKTLICNNVSASGTDADGKLADNVTGKAKTITITSKEVGDAAKKAALELNQLTGFDTLTMGNDGETENNNFMIAIKDRFDSRVVDLQAEDNNREDTVTLKTAWLKLLGDWQGHIGYLNTSGKCALTIYKGAQGTRPLLADQLPTLDKNPANKVQLKASDGTNEMGDVMVIFTFREAKTGDTEEFLPTNTYNRFEDGYSTNLKVSQTQTGTGADTDPVEIHFAIPKAHTVASFVEYPVENGKVTLDEKGKTNQKILHFTYDKENEHNVLGGYVVALPKDLVDNETEMLKYTTTDATFANDGQTFSPATQALHPVKIKFTVNTDRPGTNGTEGTVYEAYGVTADDTGAKKAIEIDNDKYWYVAHIVCQKQESYTFLLDVEAPVANTGTLKVVGSELDTKTDSYMYTVEVVDPSEGSQTKLPYYKLGTKTKKYLTYNGNGVEAGYYSITAALGTANDTADVEAAKSPNLKWNVDRPVIGETTGLYDTVEVTKRDGGKPVPGNTPARITATIPRELVENNKTGAVWAYAKDELNNTVKVQIPLNDYIIDVSVPMEVNVIAVKKPNGGSQELLAPTCYVVNNGAKEITAKVSGFATTPLVDLKLVEKAKIETFAADEISLFLKGTEGNVFTETNVLKVNQTPLEIGTLGKSTDDTGRKKAFTFDAAYDVQNINMPDGFMKNTMSYHFSVVEGGN